MPFATTIQLGKQGLTDNFLETLRTHFKKHQNVKISVLKNAGHTKEQAKEYAEKILEALGVNYTARIIGFTISLKKWRRAMR